MKKHSVPGHGIIVFCLFFLMILIPTACPAAGLSDGAVSMPDSAGFPDGAVSAPDSAGSSDGAVSAPDSAGSSDGAVSNSDSAGSGDAFAAGVDLDPDTAFSGSAFAEPEFDSGAADGAGAVDDCGAVEELLSENPDDAVMEEFWNTDMETGMGADSGFDEVPDAGSDEEGLIFDPDDPDGTGTEPDVRSRLGETMAGPVSVSVTLDDSTIVNPDTGTGSASDASGEWGAQGRPEWVEEGSSVLASGAETAVFNGSYYNQLPAASRILYDARVKHYITDRHTGKLTLKYNRNNSIIRMPVELKKDGSGDYLSDDEGFLIIDMTSASYKALFEEIIRVSQAASDALGYDHPELFWMRVMSLDVEILGIHTEDGQDLGYLSELTFIPREAYHQASSRMDAFERGVSAAMASINDSCTEGGRLQVSSATDPVRYVQGIHDYLCGACYYDSFMAVNYHSYHDYRIFTAGPVFADNEGGSVGVVCEGYAKAFKVLCDRFGIPCVLISGLARASAVTGHMWNAVQIGGMWYLVDVTWDDDEHNGWGYEYFLRHPISGRINDGHFSGPDDVDAQGFVHRKVIFAYPQLTTHVHAYSPAGIRHRKDLRGICCYEEHRCADISCPIYYQTDCRIYDEKHCRAGKAPSCSSDGRSSDLYCPHCGTVYPGRVLSMLGHVPFTDTAVAPTCTAPGHTEGSHCTACGKTLAASQVIEALGHDYQDGRCSRCGEADPAMQEPAGDAGLLSAEPGAAEPGAAEPAVGQPDLSGLSGVTLKRISSPGKGKVKVTWRKVSGAAGYQVQVSLKKSFPKTRTRSVYLSGKKRSRIITKLKSGKRYYVRIRAFTKSGGRRVFGKWSARKNIRVR